MGNRFTVHLKVRLDCTQALLFYCFFYLLSIFTIWRSSKDTVNTMGLIYQYWCGLYVPLSAGTLFLESDLLKLQHVHKRVTKTFIFYQG